MMNNQKITVGIVTFNSKDIIKSCIASIKSQTYKDIELIIFDNASKDGTADYLEKEYPSLCVLRNDDNLGFGRAHNQIISRSNGKYYMPINPDIVLQPNFIEEIVKNIASKEQIGWASGKIFFQKDAVKSDEIYSLGHAIARDGRGFNIGYEDLDNERFNHSREIFGACGAAPIYKVEMLTELKQKTGDIFDENIFLDLEDIDLDWRAQLLGWKCMYIPEAVAYHIGGHSRAGIEDRIAFQSNANRYYVALKNNNIMDVLFAVLPHYFWYLLAVFVLNPRKAIHVHKNLASRFRIIKTKRKRLRDFQKQKKKEMKAWFRWSRSQPGYKPSIDFKSLWNLIRTLSATK